MSADILTEIHRMPPVDTDFVAGRWHRDRVHPGGFLVEARVFLKSLTVPRNDNRRFLILSRARSGSTLLTRLLNAHPRIHCDREVLHRNVLNPARHFERLAAKSPDPVYGAKLLSYQMVQVHRMRHPCRLLETLSRRGVTLIHLTRDTFAQTLSLAVAQRQGKFHSHKGARAPETRMTFEPADFLRRIAWNDALLAYERAALAGLAPLDVAYERDLASPERQQATLDRIAQALGCGPEPVSVSLRKILPDDPRAVIANYDEVSAALVAGGYGHLLPREAAP